MQTPDLMDATQPEGKTALDQFYRQPDPWGVQRIFTKVIRYDEILNMVKRFSFEKILDLSCGEGTFTARLARIGKSVYGTDVSEVALKRAKARHPLIHFFVSDLHALPVKDLGGFDLIVCTDAIYWLPEAERKAFLEKLIPPRQRKVHQYFLFSARIVGREDPEHWKGHEFSRVEEFKDLFIPFLRILRLSIVQLNLRPFSEVPPVAFPYLLVCKAPNRLGKWGYRLCLRWSQWFYFHGGRAFVGPLVRHVALLGCVSD